METTLVDTGKESWMAPFAEHLGIQSSEFKNWRPLFSSFQSKVLLVEGETDKEYFKYLRNSRIGKEVLKDGIEIVTYGGKDTLKNTLLVKFVLSKFDKVFITFDLDVADEVKAFLDRLNLKEAVDYMAIGLNQPGKDAIEGILPPRILSSINGKETDLVMQLSSRKKDERKNAKKELKKKYLEEFKTHNYYSDEELKEIEKIIKKINKKF